MHDRSRYIGLTASERLELAGLKAQFDEAARARSRGEMIRLLTQVEWDQPGWQVDMIIANPRRYGY
jgi:hypothetical protein